MNKSPHIPLGNDEELILHKEGVIIDAVAGQKHELQYHQFSAGQLLTVIMYLTAVLGFPIPHLHVAPDVHFI
jgi:hypothetical protein